MANAQRNAQTKVPEVKTAAAPFNNTSADIIIRSSDSVDFYVQKAIVAEASPVFAGMFTIHIPAPASLDTASTQQRLDDAPQGNLQLYRDGIPIATVVEPSLVLDSLLRFCYPTAPPDLSNLNTLCDVLDAARKYMMESLAEYLTKHFVSRAEKEPFQVYALAASRGMKDEMEVAASQSLRLQLPIGTYVAEMAKMSVGDYVRLQQYHHHCRTLCETDVLRTWPKEVNAIYSDAFWVDPDRYLYRDDDYCIPEESKYDWFFEQCSNRQQGSKVVANLYRWGPEDEWIKKWDAPQWLMEYLADIRSLLRVDPRKLALLQSDILARYSERGRKCCKACDYHVMRGSLGDLHEQIATEFESRINVSIAVLPTKTSPLNP